MFASVPKDFDDKMQTFKNKPLHDWSSHGADAFVTDVRLILQPLVSGQQK